MEVLNSIFLIIFVTIVCANDTKGLSLNNDDDINNLCKLKKCIPKCCPEGQYILDFDKDCQQAENFENLSFSQVPLYDADQKKTGRFLTDVFALKPGKMLEPEFKESAYDYSVLFHNYYLTEAGILYQEVPNNWDRWYKFNSSKFCVDYQLPIEAIGMTVPEVRFLTIMDMVEHQEDISVISWGLLISSFFLLLVLIVYSLLRELRNLGGIVLMAYVACLLGGFLVLASLQMGEHTPAVCSGLTYFTYFLLLASFCWMNVMSCDIWWTFRGYAKARPMHRHGDLAKFATYCIYAFGLPAAMTIMLITLNEINMKHLPGFVTPNVPKKVCFFAEEEKRLYLYIPMLILIICNWVFFLMTAFNIWQIHRATAMLDSETAGSASAHRKQKYRFLVYLKLSVIMGINWVLEVVSSYKPNFKGWYVTDIYNVLIGLSIFLIFVCKKNIYRKLVKRIHSHSRKQDSGTYANQQNLSSSTTTEAANSQEAPVRGHPMRNV